MKTITALSLFVCLAAGSAFANQISPAEQKITQAREAIQKSPQNFSAYNQLAFALTFRARETADTQYYDQAEEAIKKSLEIKKDNLEARKALVWTLLGKHEFQKARDEALKIYASHPEDPMINAFIVDSNIELGNYDEAEAAAQRMLDKGLSIAAFTRTAYLRELFGDIDGSLEFMQKAYERTNLSEVEDRAWILTQMAHLKLLTGKPEEAEALLKQAFRLYPEYHYALANMAKVRSAQKKWKEAADLMEKRYQLASHPENLYDWAKAVEKAGDKEKAAKLYKDFEKAGRAEMNNVDNGNRELVSYYLEYAKNPKEALTAAEAEMSRRQDVFTLHAYARALYAAGNIEKAREIIERVLAVGIKDAPIYYHAGEIYLALGQNKTAAEYFRKSLDLNSSFEYADEARKKLDQLS